jgi:hypothetical protein
MQFRYNISDITNSLSDKPFPTSSETQGTSLLL